MVDVGERPGDRAAAPRPKKQEQEPASQEVTEVAPGILRMQLPVWMPGLGHVNCYALIDERGVAVVDPGLPGPSSWRALKTRLKAAGLRMRDVHTVIVTHSHPDHFGGAGRLAKVADARLVTHASFTTWFVPRGRARLSEREEEQLERYASAMAEQLDVPPEELPTVEEEERERLADPLRAEESDLERTRRAVPWGGKTPWGGSRHPSPPFHQRMLIRALRLFFTPPDPTQRVLHNETIHLGGREWRALHTPGHTLDHLCLYDPEHGLLLSGDHVLPTITPHISGSNGGDSLRSYLATLDLVARLEGVGRALPAHGHPFDDVPGRVRAIKRHHAEREELLRTASLTIGTATVQDLSRELFPRRHWGVMAESETFAHLEHLVRAGEAERWEQHGRLLYRVAAAP